MTKQVPTILPLYFFFERLRQNDFPLGIGEYQRLLNALALKTGISHTDYEVMLRTLHENNALSSKSNAYPRNQLLRLCKLLWLKPGQSVQLFEDLFEESYYLEIGYLVNKEDTPPSGDTDVNDGSLKTNNAGNADLNPSDHAAGNSFGSDKLLSAPAVTNDYQRPVAVRIIASNKTDHELFILQDKDVELERSKFLFTPNYFPIDSRKIQQNFRALPAVGHTADSMEIDVESTIDKTTATGFFTSVVFKKYKKSSTNLTLLIDHEGSMVAFDRLSKNIATQIKAALSPQKKTNNKTIRTFYFYNTWDDYFYSNAAHTQYQETAKIINSLKNKLACVIIISDGGAARGTYNAARAATTKNLLVTLKNCTNKVVWLNPMPKERWTGTTAAAIAKTVAMFEVSEQGIKNAVDLLKGKNATILNFV